MSDLDLKEDNLRISDIREWIGEAVEKIGAIQQFEPKTVQVKIKGHQAQLPCDLHKLGQIAYSVTGNGFWTAMRKSTNSFTISQDTGNNKPEMIIKDNVLFPLVKTLYNLITDEEAIKVLNEDDNIRKTLTYLINQSTVNSVNGRMDTRSITNISNDLQYIIKPGYIMTNVPNGYLKIGYSAIITDENGYPMIPDNTSYAEAIYWYIVTKLMYPEYLKRKIDRQSYYDMKTSWNFYCKQAYGEAMMPTVDDMETIKNTWLKLYPEINEHDTFFETTGEEQIIYNKN